jgi:hypothetical protein
MLKKVKNTDRELSEFIRSYNAACNKINKELAKEHDNWFLKKTKK